MILILHGRELQLTQLLLAEGYTSGTRQSQGLTPGLFNTKVFALFPFI